MDTRSLWRTSAPAAVGFGMLNEDITTDVLIIGGGITGLTLALLLARDGRSVTVVEADTLGSGTTGHSTGNLYETLSRGLHRVHKRWGADVSRSVVQERRAAIDFIEQEAARAPEVALRRCPLLLWALSADQQGDVDREFDALGEAGASLERPRHLPHPFAPPAGPAVLLHDQAQFQPQAWVNHLAREARSAGAKIHEHTRVLDIDTKMRIATTATGAVRASEIVMATHAPKGIRWVQMEMPCHREYAVATPIDEAADHGPGIFWGQGSESLSVRTVEHEGQRWLVWAGPEHPVGTHNAKAALMAGEAAVGRHRAGARISHRWSAQNFRSADELPYIGRDSTGCIMATGFATDGLTWGTVAARLIADQLAGRETEFGRLCRPNRLAPIKAASGILEEVSITTQALVKDYLTSPPDERLSTLAPGDSAIVDVEGQSCAAWRSPEGELHAVSAVCTHMGCKVHWNSVETSWDCPCHGSRFRPDGTVIEGPALQPLQPLLARLGQ
jgi:glycine/D-amino acid oxidase-like deaminating enzyme/nitrite reductase/ring-hydroxylating ferredoxin subunit